MWLDALARRRRPRRAAMRILLVSQFWPSDGDPDYGTFVAQVVERLEARGHTVDRAVVDHRGAGRAGDVRLLRDAVRSALSRQARTWSSRTSSSPPASRRRSPRCRAARRSSSWPTARTCATPSREPRGPRRDRVRRPPRAHDDLQLGVPARAAAARAAAHRGHRLRRRPRPLPRRRPGRGARARSASPTRRRRSSSSPAASSSARTSCACADAFARLGRGTLVVLGDGQLRARARGPRGVRLAGRVAARRGRRAAWPPPTSSACRASRSRSARCCSRRWPPSARSSRRTVGGPPEFVTPEAGALVDPLDVDAIRAGLEHAGALGTPNPAARARPRRARARPPGRAHGGACSASARAGAARRRGLRAEVRVERVAVGDRGHAVGQVALLRVEVRAERGRDDRADLAEVVRLDAAGGERRACRRAGPTRPPAAAGRTGPRCG